MAAGPARPGDPTKNTAPGWLRRWRPRRRGRGWPARPAPGAGGGQAAATQIPPGEPVTAAVQLAIGLLAAGLDSPELEAWAVQTLIPADADGLADFMAGLHVLSEMLLHELHETTGEPPADALKRLALLAEHRPGTSSAG
jgi:hypothetical protein